MDRQRWELIEKEPGEPPADSPASAWKKYIRDTIKWSKRPDVMLPARYAEVWKLSLDIKRPYDDPVAYYKLKDEQDVIYDRRMTEHQREEQARLGDTYRYPWKPDGPAGEHWDAFHPSDPRGYFRNTPDPIWPEGAVLTRIPDIEIVSQDKFMEWGRKYYGRKWEFLRTRLIWEYRWLAPDEQLRRKTEVLEIERSIERSKDIKIEHSGWTYEEVTSWVSFLCRFTSCFQC